MHESILVIEDDAEVRNLITTTLETQGYSYRIAKNGATAIIEAVSMQPDIFILDLGLPDMDGTKIIEKVRSWTQNPIIVVSARKEVNDKINALDMGADDYLTKPFSVEELSARIRVALRKKKFMDSAGRDDAIFVNGALKIDYSASCVYMNDKEIHLTPMEYKLLCLLAKNVGKVVTHNYILKEVWLNPLGSDTQSLRVFMATLRKKLEKDTSNPKYIQTHVGIGYRLMRIQEEEAEE